jgi:glycosyltransferase involved in cell wall biosynthesis
MTVCLFGNYIKDYPRITTIRQGLEWNGVQVLECQTRKTGIRKYFDLWRRHRQLRDKYDIMVVMMGGQTIVPFAKILTRKKIIFDAFASLYLSEVVDRKKADPGSFRARKLRFWDKFPCQLADQVLLDTDIQIDYFVEQYHLPKNKFKRLLITCDDQIFHPQKLENKKDKFIIHWHGYMVPFHGVEIILQAAKILEPEKEIEFQIVTRFDSKFEKIRKKSEEMNLKNIKFFEEVSLEGMAHKINEADISLGVFGDNKKTQLVIPNKIIEGIACAKPVITGDSRAVRELFKNNENICLVGLENSEELAGRILELKNNPEKRNKIVENGYQLFLDQLKQDKIMNNFLDKIIK